MKPFIAIACLLVAAPIRADVEPADLAALASFDNAGDRVTRSEASAPSVADAAPGLAAEGAAAASGVLTADDLPPAAQPTPLSVIGEALRLLEPRVGDVFYDIGCGPLAWPSIVAARDCGLAVVAVEIDAKSAELARQAVEANGLSHKIKVLEGDAKNLFVPYPSIAIGYSYLWEEDAALLAPMIRKSFRRFVSYMHPIPGLPMRQVGDLYVYERPTATQVMQQFRAAIPAPKSSRPVAVYGGRTYTKPVCNSPRCAMCNAIRRGLGW